ncbi:MAG TPA: ABC transporter ATP-binding protein [Stellaceae bacterium]|jgi:branched-chain amino acid transport system ATP-binding protein|nr:ABC transporter ATP-binding protein [Stellaceae bacterium]
MTTLLDVDRINSFYGDSHILFDVSLHVEKNEVVALLGRNGAGKSTTLKSLIGAVRPRSGRIMFDGTATTELAPHAIAGLGLQLVPEERRIFGSLNVEENLVLAGLTAPQRWPLDRIWSIFPRLRERRRSRGTDLSGGEQQMLAIARALVRDPKIVLLDEPFEGLAPIIVRDLLATCRTLADAGQTIVVVEQNISAAMTLADRVYILNNGHVVEELTAQAVRDRPETLHRHLGV